MRGPGPHCAGLPAAAAPQLGPTAASGLHGEEAREHGLGAGFEPYGPANQHLDSAGLAGVRAWEMRGAINGQPARIMLDCGATDDFLSEAFAQQHGMRVLGERGSREVALADGTMQPCGEYVIASIRIKAYRCKRQLLLLKLPQVDAILGMSWLTATHPVLDFAARTCQVHTAKGPVVLHAEDWDAPSRDPDLSLKHLRCSLREGAVCLLAFTTPMDDEGQTEESATSDSPAAAAVFSAYADVFPDELPRGLPPARGCPLRIILEDGHVPPNLPTYRMSPLELDEMRRQLTELLEHEFIRPWDRLSAVGQVERLM